MLLLGGGGQLKSSRARRLAFAGLLLLVLAGHQVLGQWFHRWLAERVPAESVPARLAVQLTRPAVLQPVAPPKKPSPERRWGQLSSPPPPHASVAQMGGVEAPVPVVDPAAIAPPPSLTEGPDDPSAEPGPEWPLSTRLRYALTGNYRGPVHGDAEVEWLRQGHRYQVRLRVSVGPEIAPFVTRLMVSEGELGPDGVRPRRYDEETRQLFRTRQSTLRFVDGLIEFTSSGARREQAPAGVQDTASQFVQLTWLMLTGRLALEPGTQVELPLALPRRLYAWRYEVMGQETLETPVGALPAWELRPHVDDARGTLRATVWLAAGLQFLPARIRIVQDDDTWVDLRLSEHPQQERAPARDNSPPSQGDPAS
ncbi:DUF3108 domain-containing protein [Inhella gelatinilytica]|uniref:DUF3108 domain-containing protein n=1 Tax=Inhella gelatinilytica TaxID=2795030 RepID=A0A931IW95_9BURK|nr:DUF3108 domain-containing protein [Inhella gelatinilytica]MBH9551228.1 DUF3108 domain-containing protein [Inhella gelatinilytica]